MTEKLVYDNPSRVEHSLSSNGIYCDNKTINIPSEAKIGIKLWGMIDFLCHHCGYTWRKVKGR